MNGNDVDRVMFDCIRALNAAGEAERADKLSEVFVAVRQERDELRAKLESRTQALHAAEQRELTALAELDEVRAELTEARRLIDEARKQEPVAMVVHHNPPFGAVYKVEWYTKYRDLPNGTKLYAAPVPAQPAAVPAEVARAVQILRKHNDWRRGADNNHWQATPYSPAELGRAIDTVCDHVSHSAQPDVLRRATEYAHDLVTWLHRDHYADNTTFEPFGDLLGLLSQIDNMICGWKEPQPAVPDDVAKDAALAVLRDWQHLCKQPAISTLPPENAEDLIDAWEEVMDRRDAILSAADTEVKK